MNQGKLNRIQEYLTGLDVDIKDKRYSMNFCKKSEYIQSIMQQAIQETQSHMSFGYGNVNSNICFLVSNEDMFKKIKPLLQEVLDKFGVNFWDIYVTFINKTPVPYDRNVNLLMNEINAVNPKIIYYAGVCMTSRGTRQRFPMCCSRRFQAFRVAMPLQ